MSKPQHASVRYGEWSSPLTAARAAAATPRFGNVHLGPDALAWNESIPSEGGRMAIKVIPATFDGRFDSKPTEFRPEHVISARSRVNEYGGGAFWFGPVVDADVAGGSNANDQGVGVRGRVGVQGEIGINWVDAESQRVRAARMHGPVRALTVAPPTIRAWRYSAGVVSPDQRWIFCERESHANRSGTPMDEPANDLVAIDTKSGSVITVVGSANPGSGDFTAAPKLSPDGRYLAWLRWNHPDLPWDAAELWVGSVRLTGLGPQVSDARRVAGGAADQRADQLGRAVSVCLPEWSPDGVLWWCDDASDWWHLRHASGVGIPDEGSGDTAPLVFESVEEEVGEPRWVSGGCRYGFGADGQVVFVGSSGGLDRLWVASPGPEGSRRSLNAEFTYIESISVFGNRVAAIAGTPRRPTSVWLMDLITGETVDVRRVSQVLDDSWISVPEPIRFPLDSGDRSGDDRTDGAGSSEGVGSEAASTGSDSTASSVGVGDSGVPDLVGHALLYLPTGVGADGAATRPPDGELPPLIVRIHGGPTASARSEFSTSIQFWTTRGFAVVDVNYRGSTGFGRRYRDSLRGQWGVIDVSDCLAAAQHLGRNGIVDPKRRVIRGGSSGGFTSLAAICFQRELGFADTLSGACSLYGVTDLAALARDTHKFESRYLDGLVGEYPKDASVYEQRSPLYNTKKLTKPVLLLQGSEDRIVPQSQAEVLVRALEKNDVPHAYVLFEGEGHGFVNAATISRALDLELSFYGTVLGFEPAGDLPPVDLY